MVKHLRNTRAGDPSPVSEPRLPRAACLRRTASPGAAAGRRARGQMADTQLHIYRKTHSLGSDSQRKFFCLQNLLLATLLGTLAALQLLESGVGGLGGLGDWAGRALLLEHLGRDTGDLAGLDNSFLGTTLLGILLNSPLLVDAAVLDLKNCEAARESAELPEAIRYSSSRSTARMPPLR